MRATKIEEEINRILTLYKENKMTKSEVRKSEKRYNYLLYHKRYIETDPKKEFIQSEIDRLWKSLNILDSRFDLWKSNNRVKTGNPEAIYKTAFGYAKIHEQINILQFILENLNYEESLLVK